jgi:hypothetical protein
MQIDTVDLYNVTLAIKGCGYLKAQVSWQRIYEQLEAALKLVEGQKPITNTASPKPLPEIVESSCICEYCKRQNTSCCGDCDEGTPGCYFSFLGRRLSPIT